VAERVEECLREEDTAARLGGDEFIVLLERIDGIEDATRTAERILKALQKPFALGETERTLTASIGIALSTPASENVRPQDLLRFAELSMYRAKRNREASYMFFDSGG
jgi:diguanylate cyclase (GGDEF)-like protein